MLDNWMESERRIEDKVLTVREEEKKNPSGERLHSGGVHNEG